MSEQDYASQDLKRRPFRTTLVLVSLTTVIASTTFLFLFSNVLLDVTSSLTSSGLTAVFGVFFETFIWSILLLVFILGIAVVSSNLSLEIISRRRDIGLMKSIGTLMDTIFDHFMAQSMILLVSSIFLGIALGTLLYFIGILWLAFVIPSLQFTFQFPGLQILVLAVAFLIVGYFAAQKPIYDTVHESPIEALNPEIGAKVRKVGYLDTFGLPFRLATKATGRRVKGSRRTIVTLFLSFTLASILWIGGGVVETTMDAYVIRSMGTNVVAIGDPDLLEQYYSAYSVTGNSLNDSFDFKEGTHMVPSELVDQIDTLSGVEQVESRLLDFTTISEGAAIIWNPTLDQYERIGGDRASSVLIVGIDWDATISDWYFEGAEANSTSDVWIGGEMATSLFDDPLIQSLGGQGSSFDVKAIAFEILNGGMSAMMSLESMQSLYGISGANLVLVQLEDYTDEAISEIQLLAEGYGFGIYLQQPVLEDNLSVIAAYWSLMQPLPIMALLSAFLSLMYYLLISVFGRFRDYVIMRSTGAKPKFIAKTMIAEGVDIGLKAGIPSILVAMIFSVYFLVPEAAVASLLYLPATSAIVMLALMLVVVLAAVPVYLIFTSRSELRVSEFSV